MPSEYLGTAIPLTRSRTAPQGQMPPEASLQIKRSHSDSVTDNMNFPIDNNEWNSMPSQPSSPSRQSIPDPSNPDSEEQALFEQRLCEDIYGVAVRKINQNGKSNLRYVKCLYIDEAPHFDESGSNAGHHFSSNKSVSSRHSRSSRVSMPRFLGGGNSSHHRTSNISVDHDAHRSLLRQVEGSDLNDSNVSQRSRLGKVRVLSWGKKKDVTVPLDMFTAVKKGKVNDRTRRNSCASSRILSLVTSDIHSVNEKHNNNCVSLDIEAPTRLDRDKFATAFARFLKVPLIEEDDIIRAKPTHSFVSTGFPHQQHNHRPPSGTDGSRSVARSVRSDMTPLTSSVANGDVSIPEITLTASNSINTNEKAGRENQSSSWKQLNAPLPVVTTKSGSPASGKIGATKPPRINRRSTSSASSGAGAAAPPVHPGNNSKLLTNILNAKDNSQMGSNVEDPLLSSNVPSPTRNVNSLGMNIIATKNLNTITSSSTSKKGKMVLDISMATKTKLSKNSPNSNQDRSTPATSAISGNVHTQITTPSTPATNATNNSDINPNNISRDTATNHTDDMDESVVSSITGVGFDQDLVEELHLALEKMKVELEESRAEASRAVKVAEQAIQSAENCNSKDWNNTVTHKAAAAAAVAQKKSAEAMVKARVAEERLEVERKNGIKRRKQVEKAEQQAAHWQTRAAAAEVQRFAVAEALESERKKNRDLMENVSKNQDGPKIQPSPLSHIYSESMEVDRLRSRLAMESARRRKLLDELQDLRGAIRVYCRLKAPSVIAKQKPAVIDMVSNEVLMVYRKKEAVENNDPKAPSSPPPPLCYEFDGILSSDMGQQDVYAEFEAICASVVEGFKICVMSYGQANSGKTNTMLGDINCDRLKHLVNIENEGIHLRAVKQLFALLGRRKDQFEHTVTMNIVEVHDEKLIDLLAGTDFGEQHGKIETRKSSRRSTTSEDAKSPARRPSELKPKLEIKTNRDGETVVRGVLNVDLASYDDAQLVWKESLSERSRRLTEQKVAEPLSYENDSHLVVTLKVTSKNLSNGSTAHGRVQFVNFASADVTKRRLLGSSGGVAKLLKTSSLNRMMSDQPLDEWKFSNKSLNIFREVVLSRSQYQRSVPYGHSTITHLIRDSLEADTKVVLIACVSSEEEDATNTACTLQLAQEMRKVIVGKATRHTTLAPPTNNNESSNHNANTTEI